MQEMNPNIEYEGASGVRGPEDTEARREWVESGLMGAEPEQNNKVVGEVRVINKMGLHARPAMQFVDLANKFRSRIRVCKDRHCVNAKSIMELLLLAAGEGTDLTIHAEGPDAPEAVDALRKLVESKFDED